MNNIPKYRLYDVYEGKIKIGEYNTKKEVAKACIEYADSCEDCCIFHLYEAVESDETGIRYRVIKDWHYTKNTIVIH